MTTRSQTLVAARTASGRSARPPRDDADATGAAGSERRNSRQPLRDRAKRILWPLVLLNAIVVIAVAVPPLLHLRLGTAPPAATGPLLALSYCAIWVLSFLPGWLFVRFLDRRAGVLWDEYVINLHRLGLDEPGNLPAPPITSSYRAAWVEDGGPEKADQRNVYREKFGAYYGKTVARLGAQTDQPVRAEALFPVFLCTALLAVGWTAVLYRPELTIGASGRSTVWAALSFAFAGGYVYFLQMLMRRYFQADMRAGAYVSGHVRLVSALLLATVLWAALPSTTPVEVLAAVSFVVGWFPDAGLQALVRTGARRLRAVVPSIFPAYPLNRLDGLNTWYEVRLLEEGIEDLENLVSANLVDVLLHTRVPVARLVDWLDQAMLLIHLPPEPSATDQPGVRHKTRAIVAAGKADKHPRCALRRCGIRTATDLLRALDNSRPYNDRAQLLTALGHADGFPPAAVMSLREVLQQTSRLAIVSNWQEGEAVRRAERALAKA